MPTEDYTLEEDVTFIVEEGVDWYQRGQEEGWWGGGPSLPGDPSQSAAYLDSIMGGAADIELVDGQLRATGVDPLELQIAAGPLVPRFQAAPQVPQPQAVTSMAPLAVGAGVVIIGGVTMTAIAAAAWWATRRRRAA